jgi:hypothetical protein
MSNTRPDYVMDIYRDKQFAYSNDIVEFKLSKVTKEVLTLTNGTNLSAMPYFKCHLAP